MRFSNSEVDECITREDRVELKGRDGREETLLSTAGNILGNVNRKNQSSIQKRVSKVHRSHFTTKSKGKVRNNVLNLKENKDFLRNM